MRKIFFTMMVVLLANVSLVSAHEHNFAETKQLIDLGIGCDKLTDGQLEAFGDYYMEQMHPGEAHGMVDKMMGGKGSESLKQMHIQMAKMFYCGEAVGGMMGGGMNMMGGGMMGNYPVYGDYGYWMFFWILLLIAVIFVIVWLVYKFVMKDNSASETPLGILKRRFAKGEITKKQFDGMKKDMGV